jgi:hypothetical protein
VLGADDVEVPGEGELLPVQAAVSATTHTDNRTAAPCLDTLEVKHGSHFP